MLSLRQANLSLSHVTTIVKGLQCVLNKRPLYYSETDVVTPNSLLTGYDINILPSFTQPKVNPRLIQSREDIVRRTKHMKTILARCWSKFILSYVEGLNIYKKKHQKTRTIKEGDYVLYSSINKESKAPSNSYIICKVIETILGRDSTVRSLKVKIVYGGQPKEMTRDIRRFSLLEIDDLKIGHVKET